MSTRDEKVALLREYAAYQTAIEYSRARGVEGLTLTIMLTDIMAAIEDQLGWGPEGQVSIGGGGSE